MYENEMQAAEHRRLLMIYKDLILNQNRPETLPVSVSTSMRR